MSIEKVRAYLAEYGKAEAIREFSVSSATVELAAQAVGVEGAQGQQPEVQGIFWLQAEDALP